MSPAPPEGIGESEERLFSRFDLDLDDILLYSLVHEEKKSLFF